MKSWMLSSNSCWSVSSSISATPSEPVHPASEADIIAIVISKALVFMEIRSMDIADKRFPGIEKSDWLFRELPWSTG